MNQYESAFRWMIDISILKTDLIMNLSMNQRAKSENLP
jgi:hypothetical protein